MKLFQNTSQPHAAAGCTTQFSQHELTDFYNRDGIGLLRGTEWIFMYNSGYLFCVDLRTNSDYFPIQHQLTGLYNRDGLCLLYRQV